jgi:hypothetical protein
MPQYYRIMNKILRWYFQYALSFHRLHIISYALKEQPSIEDNKDIEVLHLDDSSIHALLAFHDASCKNEWEPLFDINEINKRIKAGQQCFIGKLNGRLVAFGWFSPCSVYSPNLKCRFEPAPSCLISYNLYTDRSVRGRNVINTIRLHALRWFHNNNYRYCYSYISSSNVSSLKAAIKAGGHTCGKIYYGYILGLYFVFMKHRLKNFFISEREPMHYLYKNILKIISPPGVKG